GSAGASRTARAGRQRRRAPAAATSAPGSAAAAPAAARARQTKDRRRTGMSSRTHPFEEALAGTRLQARGGGLVDIGAEAAFQQQPAVVVGEERLLRARVQHLQPRLAVQRRGARVAPDRGAAQQLDRKSTRLN